MTEIIDDLLPSEQFKVIQNQIQGTAFPWVFNSVINDRDPYGKVNLTNYQFTHTVIFRNQIDHYMYDMLRPLVEAIHPYLLLRMKLNMTTYCGPDIIESGMHNDFEINSLPNLKTAVYYINTNDGYTRFEDTDEKVYSVENRLVMFDGHRKHTGTNTTNEKRRIVLNINWVE